MSAGSVRPDVHDTTTPGRRDERWIEDAAGKAPRNFDRAFDCRRELYRTARRGGKCAGRSRNRGPEKVVTDALGIPLTAERTSLPSSRDDAFVAVVLKGYTGMRWGEVVGL